MVLRATCLTPTQRPAAQVSIATRTAHPIAGSLNVPENNARSASDVGQWIEPPEHLDQRGPASSGSIIPDKINNGNSNDCCTAQNIHSLLRHAMASALKAPSPRQRHRAVAARPARVRDRA